MTGIVRAAIAIVAGFGLTFGAYLLGSISSERSQAPVETTSVYVMGQAVDSGVTFDQLLSAGAIKLESFPLSAVPSDALTTQNQPSGAEILVSAKQSGEILTSSNFLSSEELVEQKGLAADKIMVSVSLSAEQSAAGLIMAGDRVTVFASGNYDVAGEATAATLVIIPEAEVVLVGKADGSGPSENQTFITLGLTPTEAQEFIHHKTNSQLYLGLIGSQASGEDLAPITGFGLDN